MSYAKKIQKELDKLDDQWHDARCPDVRKFGENADREIKKLTAINQELVEALEASLNYATSLPMEIDSPQSQIESWKSLSALGPLELIKRAKELTNEG